jgi:hypothetical protein
MIPKSGNRFSDKIMLREKDYRGAGTDCGCASASFCR